MNKYYIGYGLSEDAAQTLMFIRAHVVDASELQPPHQMHVTALYLGPMERSAADRIFHSAFNRTVPIQCELDTYAKFNDALVVTLKENRDLQDIHHVLCQAAGKQPHKNGYNPHITVAKGKRAFIKIGCPEKAFTLGAICLYEKKDGDEYRVAQMKRFSIL